MLESNACIATQDTLSYDSENTYDNVLSPLFTEVLNSSQRNKAINLDVCLLRLTRLR